MKRLVCLMLCVLFAITAMPAFAQATVTYTQAPMLDALVAAGELPPVQERIPENPKIADDRSAEYLENGAFDIGTYGGTLRSVSAVVNYNADLFIMMTENLFTMVDTYSGAVTPNLIEACDINDDMTEFVFHLRKGLRWSDGEPVTIEDFRFAIEDYLFNDELTPVFPAYMRDGGQSAGQPLGYEFIDDQTFKITFQSPYGGFLVHLSVAGWKGYAELLKPAHYLKRFHKDYAEEIHGSLDAYYEFLQPYAEVMGFSNAREENTWVLIMEQIDVKNGEMTNPNICLTSETFAAAGETQNFPVLYPWYISANAGGVTTFTRNPYYHKVDAAGNQLPYIDTLTNTLVEDMEMVQMKIISGDVDYMRESATINNVTLYSENAENANLKVHLCSLNNTPTDVIINMNYADAAWQQCVSDLRFRQALAMSIDVEEIIDSVYNGFAEVCEFQDYPYDVDAANALLDDMGMAIGTDGYRTAPDGSTLSWYIYNAQEASDIVPVCELLEEYWNTELHLNVNVKSIESTLLKTMQLNNEIPMSVTFIPINVTWFNLNWGQAGWCPLWEMWWKGGGESAADPSAVNGVEPPEDVKTFYRTLESIMEVDPKTAVDEKVPAVAKIMGDNLWMLAPLQNVQQAVVANADLGNIPVGGIGIAGNFVAELFYYRTPQA